MRHIPFRSFVNRLAWVVGGGLLLVAGFNGFVNPFNLFEGPRIRGFNDYKYRLIKYQRLSKAAEVARIRPQCLILGTSRAQIGLDPSHDGWQGCRAYNLALNNAGLYESMRYFQHAAAIRTPEVVVLELRQNVGRYTAGGFAEERLATTADGTPNPWWRFAQARDVFTTLISWDGVRGSWGTIFPAYQRRPRGPEDGYWEYTPVDPNMLRRGQRDLFRRVEQDAFGRRLITDPRRARHFRDEATVYPRGSESRANGYQYLRTILQDAHRLGTRMHLVILPSHARLWSGMLDAGGWSGFEAEKRLMVQINEDEARRANAAPFPLWDFSGFNIYTTEPVPAAGDRQSRMRWYWDPQHFTKELGDRVLDRVLGFGRAGRTPEKDFGVLINSGNIEAHLVALRVAGDRWRDAHPEDALDF